MIGGHNIPSDIEIHDTASGTKLPASALPATAIQALYHAVTGKTERLSKTLDDNVKIEFTDIENLYHSISQQIEHYDILANPTVTVLLKTGDNRTIRYSSWERFRGLQSSSSEITSEVSLKIEFVAKLPQTDTPQRCVIGVNLDSFLPVLADDTNPQSRNSYFAFLVHSGGKWKTCRISIDFVDFLIAERFTALIEKWFSELEKLPVSKTNTILLNGWSSIEDFMRAVAPLGLATYAVCLSKAPSEWLKIPSHLIGSVSNALLILSCWMMLKGAIFSFVMSRASSNITPTVILLTQGDKRAYERICENRKSTIVTVLTFVSFAILNIILNVSSNYIYTYFSTKN